MIKKSDKLFDFIQTMTSHERGYFKHSSNKDSFYVILFDAMCKQKEYNENELVKEMRRRGCRRKITAMKDYLWRELTQAMAPYHLIKTPLGEAMSKMQALHLMLNKGLSKHIIKELDALKKFCIKFELYDTWLHALQFEFKFGFHQHLLNDDFWNEFHEAVQVNMMYMQLSEIQHRLYVYVLRNVHVETNSDLYFELKSLMNHPVLAVKKHEKMVRMNIAREAIFDLYAQLLSDYNGMIVHNIRIADLLENNPHLIKDGREISLIYTNTALALANAGQRKKLAESIGEIISKLHQIQHHHIYTLARELEVKVLRMLTLNDFSDLDSIIQTFREHYIRIPISVKHHLYYNITICLYKSGQSEVALDWINEAQIFYRKHKLLSDTNLNMAKLLHLLIHYEMGNLVYVRNQLDTFIRTYKPENKDKDQLSVVLKHLKRALQLNNPIPEFAKMKEKLEKDFRKSTNTIFLSLHLWAVSQIKQKPISVLSEEIAAKELK
jgi:tetratricopeptide (TPR) repeat protein